MIDVTKLILDAKIFSNPLLKLHLWGLKIFGFALSTDQKWPRLHNFRSVFFTVTFIIFNVTQYINLISLWGNLEEMTSNGSTTLLFTTTIARMLNFYLNRCRYMSLIKEVDEQLHKVSEKGKQAEKHIVAAGIDYTRRLTIGFCTIALLTANTMIVNSFFEGLTYSPEKGVPPTILKSWFPFDASRHFFLAFWIQFYIMWVGQIIVPCWHAFMVGLMVYVISSLKILNFKMENIQIYIDEEKCKSNHGDPAYRTLSDIITHHKRILRFVHELNDLIKGSIFIDFIVFSILLCALLFQTSKSGLEVQLFIGICYITTMITILWMYYWHANEIDIYNYSLSSSLFKSNWYEQSIKFKKVVIFFNTINAKPLKMQAILVKMDLDTFINILRASYSYFTLLTQLEG